MFIFSFFFPALGSPIALLIGALIGFLLPRFWLNRRKNGRLNAFNKQLPDTITLIANALRAGSSFLQAIELVVRESRPPISTEFSRVIREVNLGLPFEQALENMVRRVRSDDLELMATAISIQHQVGGNLAEILDSIAYTIRERIRIKGEIRTLTAQQRLSGYVVGFLPIGLAGFLFVAAPGFMDPMFANPPAIAGLPAGVIILFFGGIHDVHRLHADPQDRGHRGLAMTTSCRIVVAALAAGAILLIFVGLAGGSPVDPVQARLTQLGTMQAKNLEELELQQPFIERTLRPLMASLSGRMSRTASTSFTEKTEKRLALAGNPGDLRVADWLGVKAIGAIVGGILFAVLFGARSGSSASRSRSATCSASSGPSSATSIPEFWLGGRVKKRQKAILLMIPDTLDLLTISVRAGLGFDAALGKVVEKLKGPLVGRVPAGAGRGPRRQGAARRAARHRPAHRGRPADQLHRRDHPGRAARRVGVEGPPGPVGAAPHRAPPARRGAGGQGADQDALPARRVHLPVAVHRHPRPGDHPDRPEPGQRHLDRPGSARAVTAARNRTRSSDLASDVEVAGSLWGKFMGLMGRAALAPGAGCGCPIRTAST